MDLLFYTLGTLFTLTILKYHSKCNLQLNNSVKFSHQFLLLEHFFLSCSGLFYIAWGGTVENFTEAHVVYNGILLPKLSRPTVRKIVLVIEKNFFCKFFEITWRIYSNSERSDKFLVIECFFNLFLEFSQIY